MDKKSGDFSPLEIPTPLFFKIIFFALKKQKSKVLNAENMGGVGWWYLCQNTVFFCVFYVFFREISA